MHGGYQKSDEDGSPQNPRDASNSVRAGVWTGPRSFEGSKRAVSLLYRSKSRVGQRISKEEGRPRELGSRSFVGGVTGYSLPIITLT